LDPVKYLILDTKGQAS